MCDIKNHVVFWNGQKMPIIGLGTWQVEPLNICSIIVC